MPKAPKFWSFFNNFADFQIKWTFLIWTLSLFDSWPFKLHFPLVDFRLHNVDYKEKFIQFLKPQTRSQSKTEILPNYSLFTRVLSDFFYHFTNEKKSILKTLYSYFWVFCIWIYTKRDISIVKVDNLGAEGTQIMGFFQEFLRFSNETKICNLDIVPVWFLAIQIAFSPSGF